MKKRLLSINTINSFGLSQTLSVNGILFPKKIVHLYTKLNPWFCWIACVSLYLNFSFVWYRGRSNRLKHVWATGRNLSSFTGWMTICEVKVRMKIMVRNLRNGKCCSEWGRTGDLGLTGSAFVPMAMRSLPVRNSRNFFLSSRGNSWNTSQNNRIYVRVKRNKKSIIHDHQ